MADGTVRGVFDLDVRPAIRGVQSYKREAARADEQTKRLGSSIDDAFGSTKVAQIEEVARSTHELGDESRDTRVRVRDEWKGMRREIEREAAGIVSTIAVVRDRMRQLGQERVTPQIDLNGVTEAIAQVELLHSRLNALDRQRSNPRVGVGGGFAGGGGFGSAAARARSGAGGGGRSAIRSIGVGPLNLASGSGRFLIGAGLPAVQALGGSAVALAGSASGAALGAGATGLAGAGVLAAGLGGILAVAKPASAALKDALTAQANYTKAVELHGRRSRQAALAQAQLDLVQRNRPGLGYATQSIAGFRSDFRRMTRPGQRSFYGAIGDATNIARRAAPMLAQDANISTRAFRGFAGAQARTFAGTETQQTLGILSRNFARELPTAERSLTNVELTMERLVRASLPFFHDANVWVEHWTGGWRESTRDIQGTRDKIRPLVQEFKDWRDLSGAVFSTVRDLFTMGAPAGDSMVVDLTHTFDRWDAWLTANPRRTRQFFSDSVTSVEKMATGLGHAVGWLNRMATMLRPLLDRFSELLGLVSQLGLIGTPGSIAAVMGAYRGVRGGGGGGAATSAGAAGGFLPVAGGLGAGVLAGRGLAARGGAVGRGALATVLPTAGGLARAPDFRPGILSGGATRAYGLSRAAGPASRALRGAGRAFAPIGAGLAALDFLSFDGSFGQRTQAALSSASLGLIQRPLTAAQTADKAGQGVQSFISNRLGGLPNTLAGGAQAQARIRGEIARLQGQDANKVGGFRRFVGGGDNAFFGIGLGGGKTTDQQRKENAERIRLLQEEGRQLAQTNREMKRQQELRLDDLSKQRALQYGSRLGAAYGAYRRGGQAPTTAAENVTTGIRDRLFKIRDAGVETLGESALQWARALAKKNPEMKRQVDELAGAIEARYKKMGRSVQIVNGNILTGSKSEWKNIGQAMSDPVERAREKMSDDFTAIQRQAVGSLVAMGFSRSDAQKMVSSIEHGGQAGQVAALDASTGPTGAGQRLSTSQRNKAAAIHGTGRARGGGIFGGRGMSDSIPLADGGMAAPGEAWIANRHTLADISRATIAKYGLTAQQMIRGETRRHGYARGGVSGVHAGVQRVVNAMLGRFPGLSVTSTTGGGHAANSLHYLGDAVDLAGAPALMNHAAAWVGSTYGRSLAEGIHNPNLSIKNGARVPSSYWGAQTWAEHANHIHVGVTGGGARGGLAGGGLGGAQRVALHGLGMQQGGVPGVLRDRAGTIYARGLQRKLNRALSAAGVGGDLSGFSGGGSAGANRALGRRMMIAMGWGAGQWPSLNSLWTGESGWNASAMNPSSGAGGIPQALPASKMGAGWQGNPAQQIGWGLRYIKGRYGSPSAAYAAWLSRSPHWYSRGGLTNQMAWAGAFERGGTFTTNGPTAFVAGEGRRRREKVTVTPANANHTAGHGAQVNLGGVHVTIKVEGGIGAGTDLDALAEQVGEKVARKIIDSIEKGTAGVIA